MPISAGLQAALTNSVSSAIDWIRSSGAAATYSSPPRMRRIGSAASATTIAISTPASANSCVVSWMT